MTNRYFDQSPLPFDIRGPNEIIDTQYPSADVVEPNSAGRTRLHSDIVHQSYDEQENWSEPNFQHDHIVGNQKRDHNHDPRCEPPHQHNTESDSDFDADHISNKERIRADRAHIFQRDKFDREVRRFRSQRERTARRSNGRADDGTQRRRRTTNWPTNMATYDQWTDATALELCRPDNSIDLASGRRREPELPTRDHRNGSRDVDCVATHPRNVKRLADGPLHGIALAIYFVLLPYVVITKWSFTSRQHDASLVRPLLLLLAALWLALFVQFVRNVWRLRTGERPNSGGSAWLAGLVVAMLPMIIHSPAVSSLPAPQQISSLISHLVPQQFSSRSAPSKGGSGPTPVSSLGIIPLALMAKRRSDLLRQHQFVDTNEDIDATVVLLRSLNPELIATLRQLIGTKSDGVLDVAPGEVAHTSTSSADPVVACSLGDSLTGSLISFAREGGCLTIVPSWNNDDIRRSVVALHEGRVIFAETLAELMRSLATRSLRNTLVVYLGAARDLDNELAACSITISPLKGDADTFVKPVWDHVAPAYPAHRGFHDVRVDLLRADPQVIGLYEPLTPTLRRRCIEMLAYLALHRHEPVTGDRLRTRVLAHADVDASTRTLANTASAVRRSLGADAHGSRLHQVTSSGLYVTHGVTSDVEIFTTLVSRARQLPIIDAAPLAHEALALVKGEPLASALRGFEWFLAEGYGARLARDGEWSALVLHHEALAHDQFELAFWALQQGMLIDPYSEVLREAAVRVPRLREFGGDRTGFTQDESVRTHRTESMSWSLNGFSHEVTQ